VNLTDRKGDTRVLEFTVAAGNADRVDPASEREVLFVAQPYENHNGGHLAFGPDGLLYVGLGDGGAAGDPHGNGQNPETYLAKMVAIDVDAGAATKPRIVALGLRNPWRYAFDRATGDLWIADVGQELFEEVDVLSAATLAAAAKGGPPVNFGWKVVEGLGHCYAQRSCDQRGMTNPVIEYGHGEGCSITGGYVYRGRRLPRLRGLYFYADYCTAIVRSLRVAPPGKPVTDVWDWRAALDPEERLADLASFGEDADGELYLLSLKGDVYRFDPPQGAVSTPVR
jgi:glucose/arabinose dehydrogenase